MLTQEQIAFRRTGIGASESPMLVGASPFGGPIAVWASKMGLDVFEETEAMRLGNFLEDGVAQMYAHDTGRTLGYFGSVRHPKYPWMLCTPDRLVFGERRLMQIKLVGHWMAHHWDDGVPDYVEIQVQHEMEVCDVPWCDVAACIGGTDYRCVPVKRDRRVGRDLVEICRIFKEKHIDTGEMPTPDGSEEARVTLNARWREESGKTIASTPELERLGAQWLVHRAREKEAKAAKELVEQRIKTLMGDAELIEGEGFRCTWRTDEGGARRFLLKEAGKRKVAA